MKQNDQTERDRQARDIFLGAVEIQPSEARAAYLEGACQGDASLRSRVEALLENHRQDSFLEGPGADQQQTLRVESVLTEAPGTKIGRYKLLQQIGEGGMGVVYLAEQTEPVTRKVALKIIKLGMDTRQVIARFEAERQALAMMDHPNIAKVLDGGTTETGRPYFVMELVQGVPITEFCDKSKLVANERLKLFIQVCQAVHSAHQKGIIHRDLKPSNILVTLHHGEPMPKVIDFGIAKATNQKLTEKTLFTAYATMIGTPAYMSPEQAEMTSMDVDTRTDIYSLGVLLYELLTGSTPFPDKRLRSLGYGEMQRVIVEEEPERPSARLSTLDGEQKSAVAKNRGEELAVLNKLLRGDLDWIVMRCLEKDRTRRYETANGLTADILRHLNNEPVNARPPSGAYKFQKAWKRNKLAFTAGTAVAAALVLGLSVSSWMFIKERQAYRRAVDAEHTQSLLRETADRAAAAEGAARRGEYQQRLQAEARAYAADIHLAQQALSKHNLGGARRLLDRHRPQLGRTNQPGWEWRYLWGESRSDALFKVIQKTGTISSLAVSPDGRILALSLLDGGVSVLDISTLREPRELAELPTDGIGLVSFSPREPLLAYSSVTSGRGGGRSTITLWNFEKKENVATLRYDQGICVELTFVGDGSSLVVGTMDAINQQLGTVDLLDTREWKKLSSFTNNFAGFSFGRRIAVVPGQREAALAGKSLQVIDLSTGAVRWTAKVEDKQSSFNALSLSPDGSTLFSAETSVIATSGDALIRIWDISNGKEIGPRLNDHRGIVNRLIVTPDGKSLVSAGHDQTIHLWDVSDPKLAKPQGRHLQGNTTSVGSLALLPDGRTILSGSADGSVYAWDITAIRNVSNPIILPRVNWWEFGPEGNSILTLDEEGQLSRRQGEGFQVEHRLLNVGKEYYGQESSKDGRWFATGSTNGTCEVWDLLQAKSLGRVGNYPGRVSPRQFSNDGTRLIVLDEVNQLFCEWDLRTFRQTRTFRPIEQPFRSSFSDDLQWYLSATYMGTFSLEERRTGRTIRRQLDAHNVTQTTFSHDGKRFAATSFLGYAKVWETEGFRPVTTVGDWSVPYRSVCFSPDGTRLITGSGGLEAITLWDLGTELELLRLAGTSAQYYGGQFSPDGNTLAAWGSSRELHLWRAPSWAEIEKAEAATVNSP